MQGLRRSQRALMGCLDKVMMGVRVRRQRREVSERNECQGHGEGGTHNQTQRDTPVDHRFKL